MAKPNKYAKCTTEDFDRLLRDEIRDVDATTILQIPGVYEILSEYYNNDVLDAWDREQAAAAMPAEEDSEYTDDWAGHQCDIAPDTCWIDDVTGEHVDATTSQRTPQHPKADK